MPESQMWSIVGCPTLAQLRDAERRQVSVEFEIEDERGKCRTLNVVTQWIDAGSEPRLCVVGFVEETHEEVSGCFCPKSQERLKGELKIVPTMLSRKASPLQVRRRGDRNLGFGRD